MSKPTRKILIIAIFVAILIVSVMILLKSNRSQANDDEYIMIRNNEPCKTGDTITFNNLYDDNKVYCLEHGKLFVRGEYKCYEIGKIDAIRSYLIETREDKKGPYYTNEDAEKDLIANVIWELEDESANIEYKEKVGELLDKAKEATTFVVADKNNISIAASGEELIANEKGEYGAFILEYPTFSNGEIIGNIQIVINGKNLTEIPKSGEEFYLTEEDGIKEGENNTIQVKYTGTVYSGTYGKFDMTSNQNAQDLIYIVPETEDIINQASVNFYAGKPKLEIYIDKIDTNGKQLDGEKFQIYGVTKDNADIKDDILIIKAKKGEDTITTIFTETKAPDGYVKLEKPIELKFVYDINQTKWINQTKDFKFPTGEGITIIEEKDNRFKVQVENRKMITISGQVWKDGQTGIKDFSLPNGKKDEQEEGISGVLVNLVDSNNNTISSTVTDDNGIYKLTNVPETLNDIKYHIEFVYDGINYVATTIKGDSDATEFDRTSFNNKFYTITREDKDIAISKDGNTITELDYNSTGEIQTMEGNTVNSKYAITAKTEEATYNQNATGIDLGLVKKDVDLAAVTEISSATVKINGKETKYKDITGLKRDSNGNLILENPEQENVKYNLYLYNSDYNYRIRDYKLEAARNNYLNVNMDSEIGDTVVSSEEKKQLLYKQRANDGDLSVEVEYQIQLNNQSATNATINEIAYYYDTNYEIGLEAGVTPELVKINEKWYNKVIMPINQILTDKDNQIAARFTFTVKKDNLGNVYTGAVQNWVEIVSYSTNDGCIDYDSAPNNISEHKQEDDTDDAAGLNIQLNNIERQVSGYVFEDKKSEVPGAYNTGDGKYNENESDDEKKIDDVIVQLIEIKEVGTTKLKLEYIWQETVSGSKSVRYIPVDGQFEDKNGNGKMDSDEIPTYEVSNEQGQYTFNKYIIPGDYIVRFIYGDGTYYETSIDGTSGTEEEKANRQKNITTYNGQDYKSTIDIGYNETVFDNSVYKVNSSMARDNEARRLEQMAYATSLTADDVELLKVDSQIELENTWMCAETSTISMNVSENQLQGDSTKIVKNANFGLVKRPRAILKLEKHITKLELGEISATAEFEKYDALSGKSGIVETLNSMVKATASYSEKEQRGLWIIETDIDNIGGEPLKVTYSYRITNIGDIEYIGKKLKDEVKNGEEAGKTQQEVYKSIINNIKKATSTAQTSDYKLGDYLGKAYYTGGITSEDKIVSIPFKVEEYLSVNSGLQQNGNSSDFEEVVSNAEKNIWNYNTDGTSENDFLENVRILQSESITLNTEKQEKLLELNVSDNSIDTTKGQKEFKYRSYAAQLIYATNETIVSEAGTLFDNSITLGNLGTKQSDGTYYGAVQSYVDNLEAVPVKDIVPEHDEFIAETVVITLDTGADKQTPVVLITVITAGLAIVAVGIVLIKKFIIK